MKIFLSGVMSTLKNAHMPRPPRSKSTNSRPNNPQTRTLKTATAKTSKPVSQSQSDNVLNTKLRNLSVNDRKPPNGRVRSVSSAARTFSSASKTGCKTLDDVAKLIANQNVKHIIVMAGAGISTASGIPDFRTPGTGLYDNLKEYNIPYPEAIFDIDYFHYKPKPFFTLAKELYPGGKYKPNYVHYFVRMLHEKGLLHKMYTQNIDGLERLAGIPASKLVEAHGTFSTASCIRCGHQVSGESIRENIFGDKIPRCSQERCNGIVKPDIVFFGEDLPKRFYLYMSDFPQADLLIVMGTSLEVEPFASIVDSVRFSTPRLLINRELVGPFKNTKRPQDATATGDLVENVKNLCDILGWKNEICDIMSKNEESLKQMFLNPPVPQKVLNGSGDASQKQVEKTLNSTGLTRPSRFIHTLSAKSEGHIPRPSVRNNVKLPAITGQNSNWRRRTVSTSSESESSSEDGESSEDSDN